MKIAYVSHARFPTEKAYGHQIARVCEALTALKHDVTLIAPDVHNEIRQDPNKYYDIKSIFSVEQLPVHDALRNPFIPGHFAMLVTMRSYRKALAKHFQGHRYDLLYARSHHIVPALLASGRPVVLELHAIPKHGKAQFASLCKRCKKVVCLTSPMQRELMALGIPKSNIIVEGDAVDVSRFAKMPSTKKAKYHFGAPDDIPVIGYVGSLVTMDKVCKGVDLLINAAVELKKTKHTVFILVVGGPKEAAQKHRHAAIQAGLTDHEMQFYGPVPGKLVPDAIAACDVCVYPAPVSKHKFFLRDTSPLKLFEYFAAGKPVVCADIPPVHDIADSSVVRFFHQGNASSLAGGIRDVLDKPKDAKKRAEKARKLVENHTWEKRMGRIMKSI